MPIFIENLVDKDGAVIHSIVVVNFGHGDLLPVIGSVGASHFNTMGVVEIEKEEIGQVVSASPEQEYKPIIEIRFDSLDSLNIILSKLHCIRDDMIANGRKPSTLKSEPKPLRLKDQSQGD